MRGSVRPRETGEKERESRKNTLCEMFFPYFSIIGVWDEVSKVNKGNCYLQNF